MLPVFASRPACNMSQIVFRNAGIRGDIRDGAHFDAVMMLEIFSRGPVFVDHESRCSFRVSADAYGRQDVLSTPVLDNLEYSNALLNSLAKLAAEGSTPKAVLAGLAARRGLKSLIHFLKTLRQRKPEPEFVRLARRFLGGIATGWRVREHARYSDR